MFEGWGAAVAAVGVTSAVAGGIESNNAASAEEQASQNQIAAQQSATQQILNLEQPWVTAGNQALSTLQAGFAPGGAYTTALNAIGNAQYTPGTFQSSPAYAGYEFQQQQGAAAIQQQAAATGKTYSPATAQALMNYNQGLASTSYENWENQGFGQWEQQLQNKYSTLESQIGGQQNISGQGQAAAGASASAIQAGTNSIQSSLGSIGNAQAAGDVATGSAISSGLGSALGGALSSSGQISIPQELLLSGSGTGAASNPLASAYYASLFQNNNASSALPTATQIQQAGTLNTSIPTTYSGLNAEGIAATQ